MFSSGFVVNDRGSLVYFTCDVEELFGVSLKTPGVKEALTKAFNASKIPKRSAGVNGITNVYKIPKKIVARASGTGLIPYDTGLMLSSYTMEQISNTSVSCFFNPADILGKKRKRKIVTEYYPAYLYRFPQHRIWVETLALYFYDRLKIEMEKLKVDFERRNVAHNISFEKFDLFWIALVIQFKKLIDEEKKRLKAENERKKQIEIKRREFQEKIKNSVNSKQRR